MIVISTVPHVRSPIDAVDTATASALKEINALLRESSGTDFSLYKADTLLRRIERRAAVRRVSSIDDYARLLRTEPQELELLFRESLIGVTRFFRDASVWDELRDAALPALMARHPAGKVLRAWVPACSTGEEAYSLAIVFAEAVEKIRPSGRFALQIFATDLDAAAIEVARKGRFPANVAADVSPERLMRFFTAEDGAYRVDSSIRESVIFAVQDVAADPPIARLDLLSCRNLLIYFESALQKRVMPLFHRALNPGGLLILGRTETVGDAADLFTSVNFGARIYQRTPRAPTVAELEFTARALVESAARQTPPAADIPVSIGDLTDRLVQRIWAPAAVLVTADGDIVYISGSIGKYLEPAAGKTNFNVHAMARQGLRELLPSAIRQALQTMRPVVLTHLRLGSERTLQSVDVTVQAFDKPAALSGHVIIVFKDIPATNGSGSPTEIVPIDAHEAMARELLQARAALREMQEEMQTKVEDLKASFEELQATNEELQSSNEELTASREELRSLNVELHALNVDLQCNETDLALARDDLANVFGSSEIAVVFLDTGMNVRRFSPQATKLFRLIDGDIGRPLSDVVTVLDYAELLVHAREVRRTLLLRETIAGTVDGRRWRVRAVPYRTNDDVIDGVVLTFADITDTIDLTDKARGA